MYKTKTLRSMLAYIVAVLYGMVETVIINAYSINLYQHKLQELLNRMFKGLIHSSFSLTEDVTKTSRKMQQFNDNSL